MSDAVRILIVDDEPNVRLMFRTSLETLGYEILEAGDGEAALAQLAHRSVNLVLLDLRMTGLSGIDLLGRLRASGDHVPVVIVTAYGSVPDAVAAMKLGAIDFLTKPVAPELLRCVVAEILCRHAPEPPPRTGGREPVTADSQFTVDLSRAKRALNLDRRDEAEVYLKQAIALNPHSAEAHNLLGVLHELRNEHDAAYREYRSALKADRHHEPAKRNMKRYYERFTFGASPTPLDTGEP
jgi:DNA-binding response OmpR family regulator